MSTPALNGKQIDNTLWILFGAALLVNFSTISTPFFSDDPGLYGSIAKELIYKHTFWELYSYGIDWLDKPHLPFWLVMFSFKAFGIHTWTYKLPALICFLLSLLYTFLFTRKYYGQLAAVMAVLIVSTSLHIIMSNTDVRAEPYLMAFIIGAIYHISNLEIRFKRIDFILAALLTAFAIMTKGIFVIVPIYAALGGQLLLQKRYAEIFRFKWIALVLLTIVFSLPEIYSLYIQFDLHPEKLVFEKRGVSGIKWFLYDSQFGRFTNDGPITRAKGDIFFFVHTLLWALAPWCLIFYYTLVRNIKRTIKGVKQPEYYALSGGLVLFLLFSVSSFQLPFYTNIIFPLFAVVIASFCSEVLTNKAEQTFRLVTQQIYIVAFPIVVLALHFFLRPQYNYQLILGVSILIAGAYVTLRLKEASYIKTFILSCLVMIFVAFYLNTTLYPILVADKGQIKAAEAVNRSVPANQQVYSLKGLSNVFQFYCDRPAKFLEFQDFNKTNTEKGAVFFADQEAMDYFNQQKVPYQIINTFWDYPRENLLPAYINHQTRQTTLEHVYLIRKP